MKLYPYQIDALEAMGVPYREPKPERTAKRAKVKAGRRANIRRLQVSRAKGKSNMSLAEILSGLQAYNFNMGVPYSGGTISGRLTPHDPQLQYLRTLNESFEDFGKSALLAAGSMHRLSEVLEREAFFDLFDEDDEMDPIKDFAMRRTEPFESRGQMIFVSTPSLTHTADLAALERRILGHYAGHDASGPVDPEKKD